MAFRFSRRMKIAPGIHLNLSKSGGSLSVGPRGAKTTIGTKGVRHTVGVPGTGLSYTNQKSWQNNSRKKSPQASVARQASAPAPSPDKALSLGFFKKLFTPKDEQLFVEGLKAAHLGNEHGAIQYFEQIMHLPDAAFMAGFLWIKRGIFVNAITAFEQADKNHHKLGETFQKYKITPEFWMPITEEYSVYIVPSRKGLLLGLVEAAQAAKRYRTAIDTLMILRQLDPDDVAIKLSLADLILEISPNDKEKCTDIVTMTSDLENESPAHAVLLLYKARALRAMELYTAARDTLTTAFRKKADRDEDLLRAIQYERALVYEELGQKKRAQDEFEKIFADAPDFEDVAQRLGL